MSFPVGSLVRARGREWVVLPGSDDELLRLRPLGGMEEEETGIYTPLEPVETAHFDLPDPSQIGDDRSCRLLRDAVRLSSRAGAGPFRSFARIGFQPHPYQLVPLLVALKLDPVRLLIADDVGIGKTIEACLIARELLDRGEIEHVAVLCPPHLAEQWQAELRDKFHIDAKLVLASTAHRLERQCGLRVGESLFDFYRHVVVSSDFIKAERRRDDFARSCPEFVIIDEAHTCAFGYEARGGRHQRFELVKRLAADANRHMVLVTATPHSGKEEAFRSLLTFLDPGFANLPDDLAGRKNEPHRRRLAAHFVQRRRGDIKTYLKCQTVFPRREPKEEDYRLTPAYRRLFERVLAYARETVRDPAGGGHRQRVRWWSALALLRALASSPDAAAATLRSRASPADAKTPEEADEIGRRTVLDIAPEDQAESIDVPPGADPGEAEGEDERARRRLLAFARDAEKLAGQEDAKLGKGVQLVKEFLDDGFHPILFCRFIPTAEYVARELRARLPSDVAVEAVTGKLPPADRKARVEAIGEAGKRVLVCTDCLSEGINLQERFDAVLHYDLSWNPTRHEQRIGRVDRFGQDRRLVRVVTLYGLDNRIDPHILEVLIKKHRNIRKDLGISVPVPIWSDEAIQAIFEGVLRCEEEPSGTGLIPGMEAYFREKVDALHTEWDDAAEREKRSRSMFAQRGIHPDEVARELKEVRDVVGSDDDVRTFVLEALRAHNARIRQRDGLYEVDVREMPRALRGTIEASLDRPAACRGSFRARFKLPVGDDGIHLSRTHPVVEALAVHVMDTALDPIADGVARRAGAIRTKAVEMRTTILLVRFRYDIATIRGGEESAQLAEESRLLAFAGPPARPEWLDPEGAEALLEARPDENILPEQARGFVGRVLEGFDALRPYLEQEARRRAEALLEAHRRVREAARVRGVRYRVEPRLPADVLGIYVLLPAASGGENR